MTTKTLKRPAAVAAAPAVTGPLSDLIAALKFVRAGMSNEETRYYLKSVCFHFNAAGLHVVSTDGHRMHHFMLGNAKTEGADYQFVLNRDDVLAILKAYNAKGKQRDKTYSLDFGGQLFAGHLSFKPLDAKYPDWQRVMPRDATPALHWYAEDGRAVLAQLAAYDRGYAVRMTGTAEGASGTLKLERRHHVSLRAGSVPVTHSTTVETGVAVARNCEVGYQAGYVEDIMCTFAEHGRAGWKNTRYPGTLVTLSLPEDDSYGPGMWRSTADGPFIVIMPMRI